MKITERIIEQLKALGYKLDKELTREEEKQLEIDYTKPLKVILIAPRPIGEVMDGKARYEAKLSEAKEIENQKQDKDFIGFRVLKNQLIEYYLVNNQLHCFIYDYNTKYLERNLIALFILIKATDDKTTNEVS